MPKLIIATLSLTAFTAGLSEFIVIGLLSQIAAAFDVTMSQVGLLVTFYALGITLGSPLITRLTLRYNARILAIILMLIFSILSFSFVIISNFTALLIFRLITGSIHGAYFSITSASLPTITDSNKTLLAMALMFSGLTVSMVIGVPVGILASVYYGWQAPFIVISFISAISSIFFWFVLPETFGSVDIDSGKSSIVRFAHNNKKLVLPYFFTVLAFGGGFVFFSYAEPWLIEIARLENQTIALIMGIAGLGSFVGNIIGGIIPAKIGLPSALLTSVAIQIFGLLGLFYDDNSINSALYIFIWSVGAFSAAPMVQVWTITDAKKSDTRIAASFNVSAFNLGLSISSFIATKQISAEAMLYLPLTSAFIVMLAIPICLLQKKLSTGR